MADRYVATTGNDSTGTGSQGNPYATVSKALSVSSPGDTIYLLAGTYNQRIYINGFTATEFSKLVIRNAPEAAVYIQGDGSSDQCVLFNNSTWVDVIGLTVRWNESIMPPDWKMSWVRFVNSTDCRLVSCTVARNWVTTSGAAKTLTQEYADRREPGVQFAVGATRCGVVQCIIYGVNKGVQWNGISQDCYVRESTVYNTVQSNLDIALLLTGTTSRAGVLIEDNNLGNSYIEDNIQSHNSTVPTALTERGITIRGNRLTSGREDSIDLKNAGQVLIENNDISGCWGSNNGSLPATGNNRGSLFVAGAGGADPPATHIIVRNNRFWDGSGPTSPLDYWMMYNNVFLANNRDYTGHESTYNDTNNSFPAWVALTMFYTGSHTGFRNNLVANHNTAAILHRTAEANYDGDYNCFVGNDAIACVWANNAWPLYTLAEIRTWLSARGWTGGTEANSFELASLAAVKFANVPARPTYDEPDLDWSYLDTSPLIGAGGHLTTANGAGVASTSLTVHEARWFYDGFGRSDQAKDIIYIEGVGSRQITAINYTTGVITIATSATWSNGAKVYYGSDAVVNIGLDNLPTSGGGEVITGGNSPAGMGREPAQLTSGAQTFDITGIDSLNAGPLALVLTTGATSESGVDTAPAMFSVGVGNLTAQRSVQMLAKNGVNPASDVRRSIDTAIAQIQNPTNGTVATALTLTNIQQTALTGTWSAAPSAAYLVHSILFNSNASYVADIVPALVDDTVSFNPGFVADALIVFGNSKAVPNTSGNADFIFSFGVAIKYNDTITQASFAIRDTNGTPTIVRSRISDTYVWQHLNSDGSILSGIICSDLGSTISLTTDLFNPGSPNDLVVAALKFDVPLGIGIFTGSPQSTPSQLIVGGTGVGPGLLTMIGSMLGSVDVTTSTTGLGGSFGFGFGNPNGQMTLGLHMKDASATSDTDSYSVNNKILDIRQHDGSTAYTAVLNSFQTNGFTLDWANTNGVVSKKFLVWSIGGYGHSVVCTPMPVGSVTTIGSVIKGPFTRVCTALPVSSVTQIGAVTTGGYTANCTPMPVDVVTTGVGVLGAYSVACTPMPVTVVTNDGMRIASIPPGTRVLHLRRRRRVFTLPLRTVMSSSIREIIESPLEQGEDEVIPYVIDTTNWGGSPTLLSVTVKRQQRNRSWVDVTGSTTSGNGVESGNYVATPNILNLIAGNLYRVEILIGIDNRQEEAYIVIRATE